MAIRAALLGFGALCALIVVTVSAGCTDEVGPAGGEPVECGPDEVFHPLQGICIAAGGGEPDVGYSEEDTGQGDEEGDGDNDDPIQPCTGWECEQVNCPPGEPRTSISGRVTIPAGTLPLPDVTVFVPNAPLAPIVQGASCERCEDQLSGSPLVHTTTDIDGNFRLHNAPAGDNVPLVIQIGKWRRELVLERVEPCQDNRIVDESRTRLPRNRSEGSMPRIAVSTGGWDALECLVRKVGVDPQEMTHAAGGGTVHLYAGQGGTNRFESGLHNGAQFQNSNPWWNELGNLLEYDILLLSCEGEPFPNQKSTQARAALYHFTQLGGRVFLSHWHNIWLQHGPQAFQSVANWNSTLLSGPGTAYIDSSFPKGELLRDWMVSTGTEPIGEVAIDDTRGTIQSINSDLAQRWLWLPDGAMERVQYFSFNSPVGADEDQQCGRVVFSDVHVAAQDESSPTRPFPTGCTTDGFSPQEKALVFMLFDLSNCIIPDGKKGPF